jgi:hypothetical protein
VPQGKPRNRRRLDIASATVSVNATAAVDKRLVRIHRPGEAISD